MNTFSNSHHMRVFCFAKLPPKCEIHCAPWCEIFKAGVDYTCWRLKTERCWIFGFSTSGSAAEASTVCPHAERASGNRLMLLSKNWERPSLLWPLFPSRGSLWISMNIWEFTSSINWTGPRTPCTRSRLYSLRKLSPLRSKQEVSISLYNSSH